MCSYTRIGSTHHWIIVLVRASVRWRCGATSISKRALLRKRNSGLKCAQGRRGYDFISGTITSSNCQIININPAVVPYTARTARKGPFLHRILVAPRYAVFAFGCKHLVREKGSSNARRVRYGIQVKKYNFSYPFWRNYRVYGLKKIRLQSKGKYSEHCIPLTISYFIYSVSLIFLQEKGDNLEQSFF